MLSPNFSDAPSSPRTIYGSENENGFPGMEVFLADQTPELVPTERLANMSQPERSPSNETKPSKNFFKSASKNEKDLNNNDIKRSRNRKLWLLIIILAIAIILALAIALPLSLRHRGRESR